MHSLLDFANVIGYEFHEYKKENPVAAHHSSLYASKDDNLVGEFTGEPIEDQAL